jgi:hypothetical protein
MVDKLKQAQEYRTRAGQLRSIASAVSRQSERELLVQLADEYEEMARSAFTRAVGRLDETTQNEIETK